MVKLFGFLQKKLSGGLKAKTVGNPSKDSYALFSLLALMLLWTGAAHAGTGGTEFTEIYTTFQGWAQGYLGKAIAIGTFLTGIAIGIVRQSLMSIALGVGAAMAVQYTPNIIDSVVTALL